MRVCNLSCVVVLVALMATTALARKWTDASGKYSTEADFIEFKDGNVILKKANGKLISVPFERLSTADQEFITSELSTDAEVAYGAHWRIVSCRSNPLVPDGRGGAVLTFGETAPLMITFEINGSYPGLPKLEVTRDFTFWDTVNNRKITPYQVVVPKKIAPDMVGDPRKTVLVSVYLCDFLDYGFGRTFRGGYKPESVAVSHKGGAKLPMTQFAQKEEAELSK